MKIVLASDHAGYPTKALLQSWLDERGHTVLDLGTCSEDPVDYPAYGFAAGEAVASGLVERGIIVCGSSVGISIAANKVPGIRCASGFEPYSTELARRHNDINVIALSARLTGWEMIERLVEIYLKTPFDGGRHARRVAQLATYDATAQQQARLALARGSVDEGVPTARNESNAP